MSAARLIADLTNMGIRLEVQGDRLRYSPRSAVTPTLIERMKARKAELLAILRRDGHSKPHNQSGRRTTILCPFCRNDDVVDHERGLWCGVCAKLAWIEQAGGRMTRADVACDTR